MRLIFLACFFNAVACFAAPQLSIREALDIAEKAKADRDGGDKVYVESISLDRGALMSSKAVWIAKWSDPLPANKKGKVDVGVEIAMDGTVKHLVKGPGDVPPHTSMH